MGRLNAIILILTAFLTPWIRYKKRGKEIPLPVTVKDESNDDDEFSKLMLQEKTQAWYMIPHVCTLFLMYMYSQEFEAKLYIIYPLILPVLVQFIAGDMRFFIDARVWSLYIVFMINGVQCWNDANQCVDLLKCEWVSGIRHSNTCAWALFALATVLCCYAWSKMNLRDTIAGQAVNVCIRKPRE